MTDVAYCRHPSPLEVGAADIPDRVAITIVALLRNELFFTRSPGDQEILIDVLDTVYLPLVAMVFRLAAVIGRLQTIN